MVLKLQNNIPCTVNKIEKLRVTLKSGEISKSKCFGLGLGAQRCGSTWLGQYLGRHPDYCMSPIKEMHIFDTIKSEKIHPLIKRAEDYKNHREIDESRQEILKINSQEISYFEYFDKMLKPSHTCFGEITPEYAKLGKSFFRKIFNSHPNVKFFISLRRPINRYLSALYYYSRKRPAFDVEKNYLKGLRRELFCSYTGYSAQIRKLLSIVPKERICFVYYEDLFNGSSDSLFEICDHLGIEKIPPDTLGMSLKKVVNKSSKQQERRLPSKAEMKRIFKRFESEYYSVSELICKPLPPAWREDISSFAK